MTTKTDKLLAGLDAEIKTLMAIRDWAVLQRDVLDYLAEVNFYPPHYVFLHPTGSPKVAARALGGRWLRTGNSDGGFDWQLEGFKSIALRQAEPPAPERTHTFVDLTA